MTLRLPKKEGNENSVSSEHIRHGEIVSSPPISNTIRDVDREEVCQQQPPSIKTQ